MLVHHALQFSAKRLPDKVAIICEGERLTYAQIDSMSNRLAQALIECGVKRGERVAIYLNNSIEAVVGIFAILKAGAVFVPISTLTKREKLLYMLNNCRAAALLGDVRSKVLGTLLPSETPSIRFRVLCGGGAVEGQTGGSQALDYESIQTSFRAVPPPEVNIDLDLACLIYTSGTTGDPKAVACDHSNVVFVANSVIKYLENVESDIIMNVLPLSFSYGLYQVFMTFQVGGTVVLENSFAYPAVVLKRMEEERVTGFPGVPTIFANMLQMDLSLYDLSSLRYLTNAAAGLPVSRINEIRQRFPRAKFYSMYGLTETKRALYLPPDQLDERPNSIGIAIPGTEVWIEDEEGTRLGPGKVGELVVRGRHVMRGYWENPTATAERFRPGNVPGERVCYTGDLCRMDEEGYVYYVARKDDVFKSRGQKIAPKEIEDVICGIKGVVDAAVVGVPDSTLGNAIKAFVIASGAVLSQADILSYCRENLEDYMVPQYVEFCEELPKTDSGKVRKRDLSSSGDRVSKPSSHEALLP